MHARAAALALLAAGLAAGAALAGEDPMEKATADAQATLAAAREHMSQAGERLGHIKDIDESLATALGSLALCADRMQSTEAARSKLVEARGKVAQAREVLADLPEHMEALEAAQADLMKVQGQFQFVQQARDALVDSRKRLLQVEGQLASGPAVSWNEAAAAARNARDQLNVLAAILESQIGVPRLSLRVKQSDFRARMKAVQGRRPNGRMDVVQVRDGGWLVLRTRWRLENTSAPVVAMRFRVGLRTLKGWSHEVKWSDDGRAKGVGLYGDEDVPIWVEEKEYDDFWLRELKASDVERETRIEVTWARFEDGTEVGVTGQR
ncbi:MAG: hypothetical protein H6806_04915 [Planctomycetes bacterium]|nr:hypothetical protein [Planctomycetota bacterium]MCB9825804.1 hypothetical protein [Planctomycetota bacterium]MCB9829089.1 hypothetical protein [Planctomycetota bacterium]MCB9901203.1 hypothetical protein [Planctomycetota bacterium]